MFKFAWPGQVRPGFAHGLMAWWDCRQVALAAKTLVRPVGPKGSWPSFPCPCLVPASWTSLYVFRHPSRNEDGSTFNLKGCRMAAWVSVMNQVWCALSDIADVLACQRFPLSSCEFGSKCLQPALTCIARHPRFFVYTFWGETFGCNLFLVLIAFACCFMVGYGIP